MLTRLVSYNFQVWKFFGTFRSTFFNVKGHSVYLIMLLVSDIFVHGILISTKTYFFSTPCKPFTCFQIIRKNQHWDLFILKSIEEVYVVNNHVTMIQAYGNVHLLQLKLDLWIYLLAGQSQLYNWLGHMSLQGLQ